MEKARGDRHSARRWRAWKSTGESEILSARSGRLATAGDGSIGAPVEPDLRLAFHCHDARILTEARDEHHPFFMAEDRPGALPCRHARGLELQLEAPRWPIDTRLESVTGTTLAQLEPSDQGDGDSLGRNPLHDKRCRARRRSCDRRHGSNRQPSTQPARVRARPARGAEARDGCAAWPWGVGQCDDERTSSSAISRDTRLAGAARPKRWRSHERNEALWRGNDSVRHAATSSAPAAEIAGRSIATHSSRAAAACCAHRAELAERGLDIGERLLQRWPDIGAQPVAREAGVVVAVVFDVAQAVKTNVGVDVVARTLEPGPRPRHALAFDDARHGRLRCDTAAAKRLQQEGLGLIAPVMREQHETGALGQRHRAQRAIAFLPRPSLDAVTVRRSS